MTSYLVITNTPGYLPDSEEPMVAGNWADAVEILLDEIERDLADAIGTAARQEIQGWRADDFSDPSGPSNGDTWEITVRGRAYSIVRGS